MGGKSIEHLCQLNDSSLFVEVEQGARLCVTNARRIHDDYLLLLKQKRSRGAEILHLAAEEEASKVLILLDAVRCPRTTSPTEFDRQLSYFNKHLPKGIYAEYCGSRPATFGEIRRWIDSVRKEYYLDGPNDVDWIFYNDIVRRREETIYVDYVADDHQHRWHDPLQYDDLNLTLIMPAPDAVLRLVNALNDAGCFASGALEIIARTWRPITLEDEFSWSTLHDLNLKTLETMEEQGLLNTRDTEVRNVIVNEWLFPLYPLNLNMERVDKNTLREVQEHWSPDF